MGKLKGFILSVLIAAFGTNCFASQVSFQIVQHDAGTEDVIETSLQIEDEVINSFFEKGFIVTNSPSAVSDSEVQDEKLWKTGLGEAFEGFSDYFVQVKLFYKMSDDKRLRNINRIDWSITTANTGVVMKQSSIENKLNVNKKDDLRKLSKNLVTEIDKALKA